MFEPGEAVGRQITYVEAVNVATEEGQAGNTFDNVYFMVHPNTCGAPRVFVGAFVLVRVEFWGGRGVSGFRG